MTDNNKAFTLIELLVVVLIIGILTAAAVPQYNKAVLKSRYTQLLTSVDSIAKAQEVYYLQNGKYGDLASLDIFLPASNTYKIGWDSNENAPAVSGWLLPYSNLRYIHYLEHGTVHTKRRCRAFYSNKIYHEICAGLTNKPIKYPVAGESYTDYIFP